MSEYRTVVSAASQLSQDDRIRLIEELTKSLTDGGQSFLKTASQTDTLPNVAYTIGKSASILGVTSSTAARWFDQGKLKGYRTCSTSVVRIRHDDVVTYLKKQNLADKIPSRPDGKSPAYTSGQCAEIVGVTSKTVTRWVKSGKLSGYFIPGAQERRIPRESLVKFANEEGITLLAADELKAA